MSLIIKETIHDLSLSQVKELVQYIDTNLPLDKVYSLAKDAEIYSVDILDVTEVWTE